MVRLPRIGHVAFPRPLELDHEQCHLPRFDHVDRERDHVTVHCRGLPLCYARATFEPNFGHLEPGCFHKAARSHAGHVARDPVVPENDHVTSDQCSSHVIHDCGQVTSDLGHVTYECGQVKVELIRATFDPGYVHVSLALDWTQEVPDSCHMTVELLDHVPSDTNRALFAWELRRVVYCNNHKVVFESGLVSD